MRRRMLRQPTGPGEILWEEFLIPFGLSQSAFMAPNAVLKVLLVLQ